MIGSLWSGISGLDSYQKALNVESNNLANVNTVAFKSDLVSFADMLYTNDIGTGVSVQDISKNFIQGAVKNTGNAYDMAIDGVGFFVVQDINKDTFYTRAGNFKIGIDGTLQTQDGMKVMGLAMKTPIVVSTKKDITMFGDIHTKFLASQTIFTDTQTLTINAKSTDYTKTATASGDSGSGYKTANSKLSDVEALSIEYQKQLSLYANNSVEGTASVAQESTVAFNVADITNESDIISITVNGIKYVQTFDTDAATTLNKLSDKISDIKGFTSSVDTTTGVLKVISLVAGLEFTINESKLNDTASTIEITTKMVSGSGLASVVVARDALKSAIELAGGEFIEITDSVSIPKDGLGTPSQLQLNLATLNLSSNQFGDLVVENGNIYMKQDDNKFIVGKITTSMFVDEKSLNPVGGNLYKATVKSGAAIATNNTTTIQNKMLESSNSNLSDGLVNLMVFQRSFESNSKTITTSDELLKTAIQLKK